LECPAHAAPRERGQEGEVSVAGTTRSEPDAGSRRAPPHALRDGPRRALRGVSALERCHHIALRALPCGASRLGPSRGVRILGQAPGHPRRRAWRSSRFEPKIGTEVEPLVIEW